jgi:hypothetical protein
MLKLMVFAGVSESGHTYPPEEVFAERKEIRRLAERKKKLYIAYINRRSYWQAQAAKF